MEHKKIFANRLREVLQKKEMTQFDLSCKSKIPQSTLSLFLNGKREPNLANFRKICSALFVTPDYLLGLHDESDSVHMACYKYDSLSKKSKEQIDNYTDYLLKEQNKTK